MPGDQVRSSDSMSKNVCDCAVVKIFKGSIFNMKLAGVDKEHQYLQNISLRILIVWPEARSF